jgi:hypothetical protein
MKKVQHPAWISALFGLLVSLTASAQQEEYVPVFDIEGTVAHIRTLEKNGDVIRVNGQYQAAPGRKIWVVGDLMRRKPHGQYAVNFAEEMRRNSPFNSYAETGGNHDYNILSLLTLLPTLEAGADPTFNEWVVKHGLSHTDRSAQVNWWAETRGLQDKIQNFWIEEAAKVVGVDPMNADFQKSIQTADGKVSAPLLEKIVPESKMAQSFVQFCEPGGKGFEHLKTADLIYLFDSPDGVRYIVFHSADPTQGNLGVIPGAAFKYYEQYEGQDWQKIWAKDLNAWGHQELATIERLYKKIRSLQPISPATRVSLADELRQIHLVRYADAGWDPKLGKLTYDANSVVYPNKHVLKYNALPGVPPPQVADLLLSSGVEQVVIVGGHYPIGDSPVVRKSYSFKYKKFVTLISGDTSYSPVEGNERVALRSDGSYRIVSHTRSGLPVVSEAASPKDLAAWKASSDDALKFKASQLEKLGMMVNGYLIIGFEGEAKPDGSVVSKYENFVLLRQEGRTFTYKVVDRWGMEGLKLSYPVNDLTHAYQEARVENKKMLEAWGKEALEKEAAIQRLGGKQVIVISGPANASMRPVMDSETGNRGNVEAFLKAWREKLLALPADANVVIAGGGTTGLESMMQEVRAQVNEVRKSLKMTEIGEMGFNTGVTGGEELDPNVKHFYPLEAFYWEDYWAELFSLLSKADVKGPISVQFGGGGGIVTKQIVQTRDLKAQGMDLEIEIHEGITSQLKPSASDAFIIAALKDPENHRDVKWVRTCGGNFNKQ